MMWEGGSRYVQQGTNKKKLREHGNTWQFWKGTRELGPLGKASNLPHFANCHLATFRQLGVFTLFRNLVDLKCVTHHAF